MARLSQSDEAVVALADAQRRDGEGGAETREQKRQFRGVEPRRADIDRKPEMREHQPAAQRPARVAPVADGEDVGHGAPPRPRSHEVTDASSGEAGSESEHHSVNARRDRSAI